MPVSRTAKRTSHPSFSAREATATAISPRSVNLIALPIRFTRICRIRVASLTIASGTDGSIA